MAILTGWITMSVIFGTVILYGAVGETITEKAGNLNLGTPGIMCMGGAFGFVAASLCEKSTDKPNAALCIIVPLLAAFIMGTVGGLIFSFLTTTLRVNQNVVGLTLTIFGVGVSKFFAMFVIPKNGVVTKVDFTRKIFAAKIPFLSDKLGYVGEMLFSYGFMVYLAIVNIFKHRGHFLNEGLDVENVGGSFADLYHELCTVLSENVDINLSQYIDTAVLQEILTQKHVKRKKTFDNAVTFLDIKKDKRACEVLKLVCGLSGK